MLDILIRKDFTILWGKVYTPIYMANYYLLQITLNVSNDVFYEGEIKETN